MTQELQELQKKTGFNYKMTPTSCRTGTDRVAYLSKNKLKNYH